MENLLNYIIPLIGILFGFGLYTNIKEKLRKKERALRILKLEENANKMKLEIDKNIERAKETLKDYKNAKNTFNDKYNNHK